MLQYIDCAYIKSQLRMLMVITVLITAGCGGGGGDGDSTPNDLEYSGIWSGTLFRIVNTCGTDAPVSELPERYGLTHATMDPLEPGRAVIVTDSEQLTGSAYLLEEGDNSSLVVEFYAQSQHVLPNFISGQTCNETISYRFQDFDLAKNETYALRDSTIYCNDLRGNFVSSCTVTYGGKMNRTGT